MGETHHGTGLGYTVANRDPDAATDGRARQVLGQGARPDEHLESRKVHILKGRILKQIS